MTTQLIEPHGGTLCDLVLPAAQADALMQEATNLPSITLTPRQICDIELLLNGGFSPLRGFLNKADYDGVVDKMRLADGTLWPMPITLDVNEETASSFKSGDKIALREQTGLVLAVITVGDIWKADKELEASKVFGSTDTAHPAIDYLFNQAGEFYIGGELAGVQLPKYYDFADIRKTPTQLRAEFSAKGMTKVVAFQTRNPMHRAHKELTDRAAAEIGGTLLIHPVVGMTKPGDVDYFTRVRCYKELLKKYPANTAELALLPLAMRMGGPREAVWHAVIRKNYGCTHLVVGRDHAGPGNNSKGEPFYGPYDAQDLVIEVSDELGIKMVPFRLMVYIPSQDTYMPIDDVPEGTEKLMISGTQLRDKLHTGGHIPDWFSYKEVVAELRKSHPALDKKGFTCFFTGLSGSGKSAVANALMVRMLEIGGRPVTLLDGDVVRLNLSKGLGFSAEDRSTNVQRIGYVASEITKHGGIAICAPIAPYKADRAANKKAIEAGGGYLEIHVATSLAECERRDVKGLYAKARAGIIKGFTGIDDPYEAPESPDVAVGLEGDSIEDGVERILAKLYEVGYLVK